jgi:hypothetical protein
VTVTWPTDAPSLLVWSQLLLAWVFTAYYAAGDTPIIESGERLAKTSIWYWVRAPILLVLLLLVTQEYGLRTWGLIVILLGLVVALPHGRAYLARRGHPWGAEFEILVNLLVVVSTATLLPTGAATGRTLIQTPLAPAHLAALLLALASLGFLGRGGNHIVRGILTRTDSVPRLTSAKTKTVDVDEYNRGRVIGTIERLIMAAIVAAGAYSALAFLIGAKGLIRSKEFENRDFAEYFLIGTLSSAALAFLVGFLLRGIFTLLW